MTVIAVIGHPANGARLTDTQRAGLASTLRQLDLLAQKKPVVVLSSPTENAVAYAKMAANHFGCDRVVECEGFLRDGNSSDLSDGCDCLNDYLLDQKYILVVAVVASDSAIQFGVALAKRIDRRTTVVHIYANPSS